MAEFVVPIRKELKDSLTRRGIHNIRSLHRKGLTERGKKKEYFFLRQHTTQSWQWKRTCTSFWTAAQEHM